MVHRRTFEGEILVFGNQGALLGNAMTWFDHTTESIWSQPLGRAVAGPLTGATLELYPVELTSWSSWRSQHPDTLALAVDGRKTRFDLEDMAIVIDIEQESAAYLVPALRDVGVVNDTVGGTPVAVWFDPDDENRWGVFDRQVAGNIVELVVDGDSFFDAASQTRFDVSGRGAGGHLDGQVLQRVPAFTSFEADYFTFRPRGRLWPGP